MGSRRVTPLFTGDDDDDAALQLKERESSVKMRPRTFLERQPYIVAYGAVISVFSPAATA